MRLEMHRMQTLIQVSLPIIAVLRTMFRLRNTLSTSGSTLQRVGSALKSIPWEIAQIMSTINWAN